MWQRSDYMTKYEVCINTLVLSCQTESRGNAEVTLPNGSLEEEL